MANNQALVLENAALAFRGYNVTNLGKSPQLLAVPAYRPILVEVLNEASEVCGAAVGRRVDLVDRIDQRAEATLEQYAEAIAMIMAVEQGQLRLLADIHGIDFSEAKISIGFSLGEISALVAGGVFELAPAMRIPLAMSADCVELAHDVTMGILFSREEAIPIDRVYERCLRINQQGKGVIGISAHLTPNSMLLLGTQDTLSQLMQQRSQIMEARTYVRRNDFRWPPLHTPIVWERCIPNRSSVMLHTLPGGFTRPHPPVLSMVTGKISYTDLNSREMIAQWVDHRQCLWDVISELLQMGVERVVHVGPQPNIIPATFSRIAANVEVQTKGSQQMRALQAAVSRRWLQNMLPRRASLLRAPLIEHVNLEAWLLEHAPSS